MKVPAVFILLVTIGIHGRAQVDSPPGNIFRSTKFSKGVFLTFAEFKKNAPSITEDFTIVPHSGSTFKLPENQQIWSPGMEPNQMTGH